MNLTKHQARKQILARLLRRYRAGLIRNKTKAELIFEEILNNCGLDFIPQAGFLTSKSFYIADFYVKSPFKLIIEIDGSLHKKRKAKLQRKIRYLRRCGFKVLKLTNDMVLNDREKAMGLLNRHIESLGVAHKNNLPNKSVSL